MAIRTPPRFVTRTLATTVTTVVIILAAVLVLVTFIVRVRDSVVAHLTMQQGMRRMRTPRVIAAAAVFLALFLPARVLAQESGTARVSADTAVSVSMFSSNDHVAGMFDATMAIDVGKGWTGIARPWIWRRPDGTSTFEWYQLQLRYQSNTRLPVRLDAGVITSPLGLSTLQQRADLNPTIAPVFYYVIPLPRFDTFDGLQMMSAGYPLGAVVSISGARWDARGGVTDGTPARPRVQLKRHQRAAMPQLVAGGGFTPRAGMRIGAGFAHGRYRDPSAAAPAADATVFNLEAEYTVNHTRLSGEWVRDRFGTTTGSATARSFYLQGVQTITPRLFGAARIARLRTPPLAGGNPATNFATAELTAGYRLTREVTLRSSYYRQRPYRQPTWDNQAAVSLVWAHRWY